MRGTVIAKILHPAVSSFPKRPRTDDRGDSSVRILVADDYREIRELVCLVLGTRRDSQIVGEALDGSEAVRKAVELKPDLIVLDIDLPTLKGIEAAQQIRERAPNSKIIFLSAETSADVVQEAFRSGAWGYVLKTNIGSELLAAVEAVLAGRQFASKKISGYNCVDATDSQVPDYLRYEDPVPLFPLKRCEITRRHEAQFHSDEGSLLGGFTRFIKASLRAGNPVIVIATESHRRSLLQTLRKMAWTVLPRLNKGVISLWMLLRHSRHSW